MYREWDRLESEDVELLTSVYVSESEWYEVRLIRIEWRGMQGDALRFIIEVYHSFEEEDDTTLRRVTKLVGGTPTSKDVDENEILVISSRQKAYETYSILTKEVLAFVKLDRKPQHPLLHQLAVDVELEKVKATLEDNWNLIII